jgi:hypothetical protein
MAQPQRQPIPFGRHSSHFVHIHNNLVEVLTELKAIHNLTAKVLWVSCRLNRTGVSDPSPVFVGWVEDMDAIKIRVKKHRLFAPIDIRFGDTHLSKLYEDCLRAGVGAVVPREWIAPLRQQASQGSQEIGKNFYDETHRRSVAIKIKERFVGTLNAAFSGNPSAEDSSIRQILVYWAQDSNSALVKYIEAELDYSEFIPKP